MKKGSIILHVFIPVLWIIMFFIMLYEVGRLDYGLINIYLWFAIPVIMFVVNSFAESRIKKLLLLYFVSAVIQILGIWINTMLYYHFISEELMIGQLAMLITAMLNLLLSIVGIIIKSIIAKFRKQKGTA